MNTKTLDKTPAHHEIESVLKSSATSYWLRNALLSAMQRDCVDAARDAELLARLITSRTDVILSTDRIAMGV